MNLTAHSSKPEIFTDILYVDSPKPCRRCGLVTSLYYYEENTVTKVLCPSCKYELFPPKIILQIVSNLSHINGELYNPQTRSFELTFDINDFIACGWFIRKRIIYDDETCVNKFNTWTNRVKEIIQLEYYGNRKCKRTPHYNFFPEDNIPCYSVYCRSYC